MPSRDVGKGGEESCPCNTSCYVVYVPHTRKEEMEVDHVDSRHTEGREKGGERREEREKCICMCLNNNSALFIWYKMYVMCMCVSRLV